MIYCKVFINVTSGFCPKTFITHFLHIVLYINNKNSQQSFPKSLHTASLLLFSAYLQKYEIFVYKSATRHMDETFFPYLGLNV